MIPDEAAVISAALIDLVDHAACDLVLTTGGTGPARRDVTPEATLAVGTKTMPGLANKCARSAYILCQPRFYRDKLP